MPTLGRAEGIISLPGCKDSALQYPAECRADRPEGLAAKDRAHSSH